MSGAELVGASGVSLLLLAFVGELAGWMDSAGRPYQLLNLVGASLAAWAAYRIGFAPFVVLEGAWALVALLALLRRRGGPSS